VVILFRFLGPLRSLHAMEMPMVRRYLAIAVLFAVPVQSYAQESLPPSPPFRMRQMPPRDRREPEPKGSAEIRGRVVAAETANPLRRVQIRLMAPELRMPRLATTDAQGRFVFRELPAGRYTVNASKPGYVSLQYGQRRPFEQGRPIELVEKQIVDKVDFSLPRGGVLTGRIVDEFGDPVSDVAVSAMQLRYMGGRRRPVNAGRQSMTDDLGQFRIWGLPPGEYIVSATQRSFNVVEAQMLSGATNEATGYAPTYYPGTANVAEAHRVSVTLGGEASVAEFALLPVRTARVSGTVVDAEGAPYREGFVSLMQSQPAVGGEGMMFFGGMGGGGRVGTDGSFTLSNVTPGEYVLQARVRRSKPGEAPGPEFAMPGQGELAMMTINVTGDDLAGLVLVATKGARMTGRVTFEGAAPAASSTENLRIFAQATGGEPMMMGGMPARVGLDGKFELTGLHGRRLLRAMGASGWYLKSVSVDGRDMVDTPIEFKGSEEITNVEIVLTSTAVQIGGTVTGSDGKPAKDYSVVVYPEDKALWTPDSRYFSQARPDQDGRFKVVGLPGETYLVAALEYVDSHEWRDPEFLEGLRAAATRVTAAEGETKDVILKLVPTPF
jgi:Carboxypeptidase regulatory-like domain